MLLHNITLRDFGAYQGEQTLDLDPQPGRPIVLIGGLNGCGKTTLLDAIQLVLYGPRADTSGRGARPYNEYLKQCINRRADPADGASIQLEFSVTDEGQPRHYRIVRNWHFTGTKTLREFLNVFVDGRFDRALGEGWADHVENILPLDVASLFFFDGEKIESLADPDRAAKVVESAVHSLLGVSSVEQLHGDLRAFQNRQKLTVADRDVVEKIHAHEENLAAAEQEVDDAKQRLGGARTHLQACEKTLYDEEGKFKRAGGSAYETRKELEAAKGQLQEQAKEHRKALVSLAEGALPLLLLQEQLDGLKRQAEREREADDASRVASVLEQRDAWLLKQLGESLPSTARAALEKKLTADREERTGQQLHHHLGLPHDALMQLAALDQALASDTQRARQLLEASEDTAEQLDIAERKLAAVPAEDQIKKAMDRRSAAMEKVAVAQAEIRRHEALYQEAVARRDRLAEELKRMYSDRAEIRLRSARLDRLVTYAEKGRATLDRFRDALLAQHIKSVEVAVLLSFNKLMRKQGLVRGVTIDTDKFTLTLSDADGQPVDPGRLSAGERQLLAVSLLWGLAKVAGNRLPSIIDTPLGRLDSRHREHLVDRYFPEAGRQVLLLSTDEEIDEHLLARLRPHIAHTYTLVHDDQTFTTTVESGYWWTAGAPHVA